MSQPDLLELIDQAVREKWTSLDLSGMGLRELPPEIGGLTHLTKLILGKYEQWEAVEGAPVAKSRRGNQLVTLPSEIVRLVNLEEIDFRFNRLTSLPLVITQLVSLKGLYLSRNQLQDLPLEIEKLVNLESLTLGGNRFKFLPPVIFQLKNLRNLFFDDHSLGVLTPEIGQLLNLEVLSLRNDQLTELPATLWNLLNLKSLYLKGNQFARLPEELGKLHDLEELDLSKNQLRILPEAIGHLSKLNKLYLRDNPLTSLPKTIIRIRKAFVDIAFNLSTLDFNGCDLSDVDLSNTNLSDVILANANFRKANLCNTDLSAYDLKGGNLRNANLSYANLTRVRALGTDFSGAIFTGACIKDWHINADTKFDGVVCDYIYLKEEQQERRPSDPTRDFAPSEFFTLIQEIRETVDLIFTNGMDWAALLTSIHKLQVASGDNQLTIQAIEHKRDGRFVVRVDVPPNVDKAKVEKLLWTEYENKLKATEEIYLQKLEAKSEQLTFYKEQIIEYRSQNTNLMEIAKQMANRPLQIENKIENRNTQQGDKSSVSTINQHGSGDNIAGDKFMGDKIGTQINNSQDLVLASRNIKALLDQLSADYPSDSPRVLGAKAVDQVEKNPELKSRILRGVKAGSFAALEKMIDHPVAKFFIEGAKEVLKP